MELRQYLLNYNHNVEVLVKLIDKKIIEMNKIVTKKNNFIYFVLFQILLLDSLDQFFANIQLMVDKILLMQMNQFLQKVYYLKNKL